MKKIAVILFLFANIYLCNNSYSQSNNLEFSKVIFKKLIANVNTIDTVPSGKLWKIVNYSTSLEMRIDSKPINGTYLSVVPLWLPEKQILNIINTGSSSSIGFINIIEYNIVP